MNNQDSYDLEAVYDEKINPLMAQIIAICKEHNMPVLASFQYAAKAVGTDDEEFLFCTTAMFQADKRPIAGALRVADHAIRTGSGSGGILAITVTKP